MKRFFLGFFLIILATSFAIGQTTTGRLTGTVSGPDGVLPGATVTATDATTGKTQTAVTNGEGAYNFSQLEFGTYTVKITATGFKAYVANTVKIDVGRDYTLSPTLEIGALEETVTVTAGADVVTANTAQVSNTVSPQQILSLPLITRSPLSLTTLQAGVASNSANNTTINGMRTTFTNITRDGINIQDTFIRSNATDFAPGRPSVDDTAEFTITTTNSEADQGSGGAQIRLVTPRGTKDFHGALFAYNRNSEFAANSFFNNRSSNPAVSAKPSFRNRNQFGGKVSGPMPVPGFGEGTPVFFKDRGYFFFSYEGIRDPISTPATRTILDPDGRNGAFSWRRTNDTSVTPFCPSQTINSICTIPNILTFARGFGGNFLTIPATVDPVIQSRVIGLLPTTSNFTGGDGLNTAGYRFLRRSDQTRNNYSSRFDVDLSENDSILGIYNYNKEINLRPDVDTTAFTVIPNVSQLSVNKQLTLAWRRVWSSNFVNEFRGGVFTSEVPFDKTDPTAAFFLAPPLVTNPENTFLSQGRNTKAFNFQSNADWVWKSHTFRFGGQAQVFRVNSYNDAAIIPSVSLSTTGTAVALTAPAHFASIGGISAAQLGTANSMLALFGGVYNSVSQAFNIGDLSRGFQPGVRQFTPFRNENHSLYFSDRWAVTRELTLSLGVRYEVYPALRLNNGLALEPIITDPNNITGTLLSQNGTSGVIGGNAGRRNAYYKTDWDNVAPNLGVSWSPSFEKGVGKFLFGGAGKSVIRGGYSQIYGNDSIITSINNAAVGNAGLARTTVTNSYDGRVATSVPTIAPPSFVTPPRTWLLNNGLGIGNFFGTVFATDPNLKSPRVDQYSVGFQREFFGNTALEIRYVGSRSNNLVRGVDINQLDIVGNGFLADFERARANLLLTGNAFCATAGCQALTIFQSLGAGSPGRLAVGGPSGLAAATFTNNLSNGTPADLAIAFMTQTSGATPTLNNLNNHPCSGTAFGYTCNPNAVPFVKFLPNPAAGAVDIMLNDANYRYNSLQMEVRRRFSNGLYFQANYTFSKNLTNAVGTSQALFEPYLDNNRKELDNQRADYDQTHVFNFNGVYQLPFGKGKTFLNNGGIVDKIFGGWELSGLVQWNSGAPITFVDTRGTFNRNGRSARQTPFSTLSNDQIRALMGTFESGGNIYWINPAIIGSQGSASNGFNTSFAGQAFFNVNPGQTGNIGRAIVNGPKYFNINAAMLKNIKFTESIRVQLRMEAFNMLNNVNFVQNTTVANINSTVFGQIQSAFGPREIQFAARFEF